MIFVFLDDNTLDVIDEDIETLHREYEPQDVESLKFYDAEGLKLKSRVWETVERDSFLFIPIVRKALRFDLEKTGVNRVSEILIKLDDLAYVNPNKWFANTEAVKTYFNKLLTK